MCNSVQTEVFLSSIVQVHKHWRLYVFWKYYFDRLNCDAHWRFAKLATQQKLGIFSKRWLGYCSHHSNRTFINRKDLTIMTTTQTIAKAIGNAYDTAGETLLDIQNSATQAQEALDPMVHQMSAKVHKMMHESMEMVTDTKHSVEKALRDASEATSKYIEHQPIKSICIAAGVGAAAALLVYALRRNSEKS